MGEGREGGGEKEGRGSRAKPGNQLVTNMTSSSVESTWINIKHTDESLAVGVMYRPPSAANAEFSATCQINLITCTPNMITSFY